MSLAAILARVRELEVGLVEVTGGEPLAQAGALELLRALCDAGLEVLLETSGALPIEAVDRRVRIILDLKCPDSGECHRNLWENLDHLKAEDEIKLVIASRADYEWASGVVRERGLAQANVVLLSPVWGSLNPGELAGWMLEDGIPARMQIQMHKVLFGAEARGV
jgi:7-carboxy-7-deazaguanine synthase